MSQCSFCDSKAEHLCPECNRPICNMHSANYQKINSPILGPYCPDCINKFELKRKKNSLITLILIIIGMLIPIIFILTRL